MEDKMEFIYNPSISARENWKLFSRKRFNENWDWDDQILFGEPDNDVLVTITLTVSKVNDTLWALVEKEENIKSKAQEQEEGLAHQERWEFYESERTEKS